MKAKNEVFPDTLESPMGRAGCMLPGGADIRFPSKGPAAAAAASAGLPSYTVADKVALQEK